MSTDTVAPSDSVDSAASASSRPAPPFDVPLGLIAANPHNPRRHHLDAAIEQRRWNLDEMADSISKHGVMQPILMRPRPGARDGDGTPPYELVAGERRLLGSRLAGVSTIPALLRTLTDIETLELMVIENGQREDLHPLEEAFGFRQLLDTAGGYGTVAEIAVRVGKTERWVYNRLRLLTLCEEAQRAFFAGDLSASVALELAEGVPDPVEQAKHLKTLLQGWGGEAFSARSARKWLRENAMLLLARAPFDTRATITVVPFPSVSDYVVPDTLAVRSADVGPCGNCPKRTGAKPDFFVDDVKEGDMCQDPACFRAKSTAAHELLLQTARAEGATVYSGTQAKKFMPTVNVRPKDCYIIDRPCVELTDSPEPLKDLIELPPHALVVVDHPDTKTGVITVAHELYVKDLLRSAGLLRKVATPPEKPEPKKPAPKKPKDGGGALLPAAPVVDPVDALFDAELQAPVFPKTAKGQPTPAEVKTRTRDAEQRAIALSIGRHVSKTLRRDDSYGLPTEGISRLLLLIMMRGVAHVDIDQVARMLAMAPPATSGSTALDKWALAQTEEDAARLVLMLLTLENATTAKVGDVFPLHVAAALDIKPEPLVAEAKRMVADSVRIELLARAPQAKAKAAAKKAAAT